MNSSDLFVEVYLDLERLVLQADEYSMLRASGLMRQLLLDGDRLVHIVNRKHKINISFPVCGRAFGQHVLKNSPSTYMRLNGIHRSGSMSQHEELISLDKFLSEPLLKFHDDLYSVKDVISHAANTLGGVHLGSPKTNKGKTLSNANESVTVFDLGISAVQLKPIGLIVLDGLAELKEKCAS